MCVIIGGRVTPAHREIIKNRVCINANDYKAIFNWLIDNNPSYYGKQRPESYLQPVLIGDFDTETKNTDNCIGNIIETT